MKDEGELRPDPERSVAFAAEVVDFGDRWLM